MSASWNANDRRTTGDFAQNARPTIGGIADSLAILRKRRAPFAADALASRLDLLLLPFLDDLPTIEERVTRLRQALTLAADSLAVEHQIVYRHVFLEPAHAQIGLRRNDAFDEMPKQVGFRTRESSATVSRIEDKMLPALAELLLDPEFEQDLDDAHPKSERITRLAHLHATRHLVSSLSWEIDDDDHRKAVLRRELELEVLVPDQRVAALRYNTNTSDPLPVKNSVEMFSAEHTYLGSLPDSKDGAVASWMLHFIHLGARKEPGDIVKIEMQEAYFDEKRHDNRPCVTNTVDDHPAKEVAVAMRLPKSKIRTAKPERQVIASPHSNAVVVHREPLPIDRDGWIRAVFTDLKIGFQYGIYLPGFDLYK